MIKETQIKYICDRCKKEIIVEKTLFTMLNKTPSKWKSLDKHILCESCSNDYKLFLIKFINEKKVFKND